MGRPGIFGNPFRVGDEGIATAVEAAAAYEAWMSRPQQAWLVNLARGVLRGRNLACWCGLDKACHADVLLRIANE